MKKWLAAIGLTLWLAACGGQEVPGGPADVSTPLEYADTVASTDLSGELEGAGLLGARRQEVTAARGEPLMTGDVVLKGRKHRSALMEYADYHYMLKDERVSSFIIMPGYGTAEGISAGDDAGRVEEAYGPHYYTRLMGNAEAMGYVDQENDAVIEFVMNDGKVDMIIVSRLSAFQ